MDNIILGLLLLSSRTIYQLRERIDKGLNMMYSSSMGSIQAAIKKLLNCGYIQAYDRGGDIVLTEKGRSVETNSYPTEDDLRIQNEYWGKKHREQYLRRKEKIFENRHARACFLCYTVP